MRILITGAKGQLGRELLRQLAQDVVRDPGHAELDVTDALKTIDTIASFRPEVVIHCAAYTDTQGCERDPDMAYKVNALATRNVAVACQQNDAAMVYVSSNEVFDGTKKSAYLEFDEPNPLNAYARSKLAGERYVQTLLTRFWIVRTAWLYAEAGNNFVSKVVKMAHDRGKLTVVTDEISSPTWCTDLAEAMSKLIRQPLYGIYHFTNQGACSRFEWARKILELSGMDGVPVVPTTQREFGNACVKPAQSELRNYVGATSLHIELRPWAAALEEYFRSKQQAGASLVTLAKG